MDLANGRFEVGRDKTDAGMREVDMLPLLREIMTEHKAASERTGPDDPVFVTSSGKPCSRHNLRHDVVDAVVTHAHRLVEERGLQPLPSGSARTSCGTGSRRSWLRSAGTRRT